MKIMKITEPSFRGTVTSQSRSFCGLPPASPNGDGDCRVDQVSIGPLTASGTLNLADGGPMKVQATAPALGARADLEIVNRTGYPVSGPESCQTRRAFAASPPGSARLARWWRS